MQDLGAGRGPATHVFLLLGSLRGCSHKASQTLTGTRGTGGIIKVRILVQSVGFTRRDEVTDSAFLASFHADCWSSSHIWRCKDTEQWFSNSGMPGDHLEGVLRYNTYSRFSLNVSDSVSGD